MTPEENLARPAKALTQAQREHYFEYGYLGAPALIGTDWLTRLNARTAHYVEESRHVSPAKGDQRFDLEPDHRPDAPRIRRLNSPSTPTNSTGSSPPTARSSTSPRTSSGPTSSSTTRS